MAKSERSITEGRSVFHDGRFFATGDEDALHAAGLEKAELDRMTTSGAISGFGSMAEPDEADPTIRAGRAEPSDPARPFVNTEQELSGADADAGKSAKSSAKASSRGKR